MKTKTAYRNGFLFWKEDQQYILYYARYDLSCPVINPIDGNAKEIASIYFKCGYLIHDLSQYE